MAKKQTSIRLDTELYKRLQKYADEKLWSLSLAAENIIKEFFEEEGESDG